ncbi:hypothetical protein [Celeribacter naphthalenivorans]|uniref:hypothetical protein n=1 Tax=Celeribacter naphthalenivorans TaxID=1614694 RepID=UPI001CFC3EBA|nr:hypothetical protein [Celeribacter naphthalenivorans]
MTKTTKILALICAALAGAAMASPYVPLSDEHLNPEPVLIKVPAEDLDRCVATLEQVFLGPVEQATVQSASLTKAEAGPTVRCVAE